jgi:NAD(P)-dependent dehydrogenase (short-subunit alcohol dehydrogenase family)
MKVVDANDLSLAGLTIVVTGAGAGLGRATSLAMARAGATVFGVSNVAEELASLEREAAAQELSIETLVADVTDAPRSLEVIDAVVERAGQIDVLLNNAGIIIQRTIEDTTPDAWDRIIDVNLRGTYLYARAALPHMKARGSGLIMNVTSRASEWGFATQTAYCAAKFGVEGFTRALALEVVGDGVWAVSVHPGYPMNTPMSHTTYPPQARRYWKDPAEMAPGLVTLVADRRVEMNGGRFDIWELAQDGMPADLEPHTELLVAPVPFYLDETE